MLQFTYSKPAVLSTKAALYVIGSAVSLANPDWWAGEFGNSLHLCFIPSNYTAMFIK